jgi:hypothetical protein
MSAPIRYHISSPAGTHIQAHHRPKRQDQLTAALCTIVGGRLALEFEVGAINSAPTPSPEGTMPATGAHYPSGCHLPWLTDKGEIARSGGTSDTGSFFV